MGMIYILENTVTLPPVYNIYLCRSILTSPQNVLHTSVFYFFLISMIEIICHCCCIAACLSDNYTKERHCCGVSKQTQVLALQWNPHIFPHLSSLTLSFNLAPPSINSTFLLASFWFQNWVWQKVSVFFYPPPFLQRHLRFLSPQPHYFHCWVGAWVIFGYVCVFGVYGIIIWILVPAGVGCLARSQGFVTHQRLANHMSGWSRFINLPN